MKGGSDNKVGRGCDINVTKYGQSECVDYGKGIEWHELWSEENEFDGLWFEGTKMKYHH